MQVINFSVLLSALLARTSSPDLKGSEGLQSVFVAQLAVLSHISLLPLTALLAGEMPWPGMRAVLMRGSLIHC